MAQLAYRGDFVMGLLRNVAAIALTLVFYEVLFLRTDSIAGWSQPAILVLFGTFRVVRGILYFFSEDTITTIPDILQQGEMDFVLLKPVNSRFLLTCGQINLGAVSNAAIGAGLVLYGLHALPPVTSPVAPVAYIALIICAVIIFHNLLFMMMTISFWTGKVDSLAVSDRRVIKYGGPARLGIPWRDRRLVLLRGTAGYRRHGTRRSAHWPLRLYLLHLCSSVRHRHYATVAVAMEAGDRQLHQRRRLITTERGAIMLNYTHQPG